MLYTVVFISAVQQSKAAVHIHISSLFLDFLRTSVGASLVAQLGKNPPAIWETWVRSLGWEDALEKGKAAHSSILAWRICSSWGHRELETTKQLSLSFKINKF